MIRPGPFAALSSPQGLHKSVKFGRLLLSFVAALCTSSRAAAVRAQACHMPDLQVVEQKPVRLGVRTTFATYRNPVYAGEYQGYGASASYAHRWFYAELALAGYRIVRNGLADRGLGDLSLDARSTLYRAEAYSFGVELAATAPTGDADRGLGMGHTMVMPGLWGGYQYERLQLFVQVAYGRAVGDAGAHAHHAATGPLVNPMNRSELEHALTLSYGFGEHLFVGGRLLGAVPIAALGGAAREIASLGIGATIAPLQLELELQMPLIGAPFETRSVISLAALF